MRGLVLGRKCYALLPKAKPPPLKPCITLSLSRRFEEDPAVTGINDFIKNSKDILLFRSTVFLQFSGASHEASTCLSMLSSLRNVSARSYATRRPAKKTSRLSDEAKEELLLDKEEEDGDDNDEWSGEVSEELLRCNDNDDDEDTWEEEEEVEAQIDDGGDGGGVVLGDTLWGSKALAIAEEVLLQFKDDLRLYAFKVSHRGYIYVRLDKLSDDHRPLKGRALIDFDVSLGCSTRYGCPSIDDIKAFHSLYAERLEEAGQGGVVPDNLAVEVSSPGAERFVKVPDELERFKGLPLYVSYVMDETENKEQNGIFQLDSFNLESGNCTLKLANVKINRMNLGKGRTFSRKQKNQSFHLPICSLKLVRLHMEG